MPILFSSIAAGDYRLDICSPAIDAGDPVEILTADYIAGELSITVDRVTAIEPGDTIWITDGENFESDEVFSISAPRSRLPTGLSIHTRLPSGPICSPPHRIFPTKPTPNGRRINMGAYGGGSEAVPSLVCRADLEGDDFDVDGADLIAFMGALGIFR